MDEIAKARAELVWRDIKAAKVAKKQRELDLLKSQGANEIPIGMVQSELKHLKSKLEAMSPPGALGLPPLLDERRIKYEIPDRAFEWEACFDRVLGYQLDVFDEGYISEGSAIFIPKHVADKNRKLTPKVLVLSAGLKARDELLSHGIQLGDICMLCRMAIFSAVFDFIDNVPQTFLQLRSGDLSAGKDTAERVRRGDLRVEYREFKSAGSSFWAHVYVDREGRQQGNPTLPFIGDDQ